MVVDVSIIIYPNSALGDAERALAILDTNNDTKGESNEENQYGNNTKKQIHINPFLPCRPPNAPDSGSGGH